MPTQPIFFGNLQESGDQSLAGASPLAINVLLDGKGAVRRRPGISAWAGFPTTIPTASRVDGIAAFEGDVYWVNALRAIYKTDPDTATATNLSTGGVNSFLAGTGRPVFAETQFRLVMTGGDLPEKIDSGETVAERLGGSPPKSDSIIALASRIFTDDNTSSTTIGQIRASGTGNAGNETFDALDVVTAEARPDDIVRLHENSNEVLAFGATTLQAFSPDANTILAPGRALNHGISAAHSVIRADEEFAWLTNHDEFVVSDTRSVEAVSDPIAATLDDIDTVSDCWGFRYNEDQFDVMAWQLPTDGRCFALQRGGGWSQWHGWDGNGFTPFPATAHHYFESGRVHLVGLSTGQIAKLDTSATTDLGTVIKAEVTTGFVNHGTDAPKHCACLRLTFKRGQSATESFVLVSWRDDLGAFGSPIRVGLGTTGDYVFTVELRSLGNYRARQWKMEFTSAADFVLARAEETFNLGSGV